MSVTERWAMIKPNHAHVSIAAQCRLIAIMDWASWKVLAWRLSNTLEADLNVEVLEEAMACYGRPAIFNTDQASQFAAWSFGSRATPSPWFCAMLASGSAWTGAVAG